MAKFHYDLTGAEPIIRDVPIYDATDIANGEFLMRATSSEVRPNFISGYINGSAEMVNGLGICNETITTTSTADFGDHVSTVATTSTKAISSIANTVTIGNRYGKAIINPFAVYLTEVDQGTNSYITAVAATTTTYTDTVEDEFSGGWMYVCKAPTTSIAANRGQLRYISADAGSAYTLLTAITTTAAEKVIKIVPNGHNLIALDATGTMTSCLTTQVAPDEVGFRNIESYVGGPNKPLEPLRQPVHDGIKDDSLRFYNDLIIKDHLYNSMA